MTPLKDRYTELIHLTRLFLIREHPLAEIRSVDPAIFDVFNEKRSRSSDISPPHAPHPLPFFKPAQTQEMKRATPPLSPSSLPLKPIENRPLERTAELIKHKANPPAIDHQKPASATPPPYSQSTGDKEKEEKKRGFHLDPLPIAVEQKNVEEWKLYGSLFPDWVLPQSIPSDEIAVRNKKRWLKTEETCPVLILSFDDGDPQLAFLKNIARAISLRLAPARVISAPRIEKTNGWEALINSSSLRLIIAGDYALYLHPKLIQFYREEPQQGKHFLHNTPLLLLSDLALYLKEPQLKPLLWRAICNEFAAANVVVPSKHPAK
ncbi:MAG: hypothetical protein ACH350_00965 [Parachlamydiaceae bacterium]